MYLGIDIGGTKTLVATLSDDGQIINKNRFPTSDDYRQFLIDLEENLKLLELEDSYRCCVAVPGLLDREKGVVFALGNLPWRNEHIRDDISEILGGAHVIIENDSRLAGLSEAQLVRDAYNNVLFATVSTGIGGALIRDGRIVTALQDTEFGKMPLYYDGKMTHWEEFASGRSVVERFHKKAFEITDPDEWRQIGENIAYGLGAICSVLQPEVIILGGSAGKQADNYSVTIMDFLGANLHPVVRQPKAVLAAQRPDDAVLYGCYDLAKQVLEDG
ncbi:MAG: ROK family protein [Patescibacteria group bacterium]